MPYDRASFVHLPASLFVSFLLSAPVGAFEVCYPPEHPFVPASDDDLLVFAEVIDADFQKYFSEITLYFSCMDRVRQEVFEDTQERSGSYQEFLDRLNRARQNQGDNRRSEP